MNSDLPSSSECVESSELGLLRFCAIGEFSGMQKNEVLESISHFLNASPKMILMVLGGISNQPRGQLIDFLIESNEVQPVATFDGHVLLAERQTRGECSSWLMGSLRDRFDPSWRKISSSYRGFNNAAQYTSRRPAEHKIDHRKIIESYGF